MMEKEKLRKADLFSGAFIFIFGLWVISQGLQMPMKDSWGGVQNVWYVSPALFPLFVGAMISFLGAMLVRIAIKETGRVGLKNALNWLGSRELVVLLKSPGVIRFYAIVALFFILVFLNLRRVDFFLGSILFLSVFISMFYFEDDVLLLKLFFFYLAGTFVTMIFFFSGLSKALADSLPYPNDWLIIAFIIIYQVYARSLSRDSADLRKKYRTSLILGIVPPFLICPIFKFFLLVPMPTEGLVTTVLEAVWYWDF